MKSSDIRKSFLEYFRRNGHRIVPSSSLVPEKDPTLLFTNAGMVQFKAVFLNEEEREYKRAASAQKCMRAGGKHNDLENVGRTARHHTFFEMLGNFSFGDYFKEGAIGYAWEFLTKKMGLPEEKLWVTVFRDDDEAADIWQEKIGLPEERIKRMGEEDNFWSMGDVGPCGPCSEIIIDQGPDVGCGRSTCAVGCDCDRFLELWNLVFMQYNRDPSGKLTPLPKPSIDTGMGLERLSAVMQGKRSNYDSDLFTPIIASIEELSGVRYGGDPDIDFSIRAVSDHSRAVTFLIADGVLPSNEGRGYVLRRIIRRAVRHGRRLGLKNPFLHRINETVIEIMGEPYPEVVRARETILRATTGEEERFFETLERGLAILEEEVRVLKSKGLEVIPGEVAFKLYDTYGFPVDLTADIVRSEGMTVDEEGFSRLMEEQRAMARRSWKGFAGAEEGTSELYKKLLSSGLRSTFVGYHMEAATSRVLCIIKDGSCVESASKGDRVEIITEETPFYGESGGQVGDTGIMVSRDLSIKVMDTKRPDADLIVHHCLVEQGTVRVDDMVELVPDIERRKATARNHTATHILHALLRKKLGEHVRQSGSLVTPRGFRFDFSHFSALSDEEIRYIEEEANRIIMENIDVRTEVLPFEKALEKGALAFFGERYGEKVRMVRINGVSAELCGGTHVKRTGDIGLFKITGEGSIASGVRRIEALTGERAIHEIEDIEKTLHQSAELLRVPGDEVPEKIKKLIEHQKELEREIEKLRARAKKGAAQKLLELARTVGDVKVIAARVESEGPREMREIADTLRARIGSGIIVLGSASDGKAMLLATVTKDLVKKFSAGDIVKRLAPIVGGRGGGRPDMAQAGGKEPEGLDEALRKAYEAVEEMAGKG